jgi:plastocyanin
MRQWAAIFALFLLITVPAVALAQYDYPTGDGGGSTMGEQPPAMDDSGDMTMPNVPDVAMPDIAMPDMSMPDIAMPDATSGDEAVTIIDFAFQPRVLSVPVGSTVSWQNSGAAPHTVTSDTGAFDSGTIDSGGNFSTTFSEPGMAMYHCSIHPDMTGTVQVSGS